MTFASYWQSDGPGAGGFPFPNRRICDCDVSPSRKGLKVRSDEAFINGVQQSDASGYRCGRRQQGTGFAPIYNPTQWETTLLLTPRTRAFVSGAAEPERGLALVVGSARCSLRA